MIPRWFIDLWNSYGPEAMILPPNLLKAYNIFKKEPNIPHLKDFPHLLNSFTGSRSPMDHQMGIRDRKASPVSFFHAH